MMLSMLKRVVAAIEDHDAITVTKEFVKGE
jgi:hypothetical protein